MKIKCGADEQGKLLNDAAVGAVLEKYPFKAGDYAFAKYSSHPVLSKIIIPDKLELEESNFFTEDPLGDKRNSIFKNIVQKYPSRLLIMLNNNCAAHCRYCNRKNFWKDSVCFDNSCLKQLGEYIKKEKINEIILSGGEPFLHNIDLLEEVLDFFTKNSNISVIRIHTKILSFMPEIMLSGKTMPMLKKYSTKLWIFTHFAHPDEICVDAPKAAKELLREGIVLLNQNPILKDINDSYDALEQLFKKLLSIKIKPQYLFQLDPAAGTTHFYVDLDKTLGILKKMQGNLSGMAIPRFLVDLPDGFGKVPISPNFLLECGDKGFIFESRNGEKVFYPKKT